MVRRAKPRVYKERHQREQRAQKKLLVLLGPTPTLVSNVPAAQGIGQFGQIKRNVHGLCEPCKISLVSLQITFQCDTLLGYASRKGNLVCSVLMVAFVVARLAPLWPLVSKGFAWGRAMR
eukprot:3063682-Amphidinium_carterae.1